MTFQQTTRAPAARDVAQREQTSQQTAPDRSSIPDVDRGRHQRAMTPERDAAAPPIGVRTSHRNFHTGSFAGGDVELASYNKMPGAEPIRVLSNREYLDTRADEAAIKWGWERVRDPINDHFPREMIPNREDRRNIKSAIMIPFLTAKRESEAHSPDAQKAWEEAEKAMDNWRAACGGKGATTLATQGASRAVRWATDLLKGSDLITDDSKKWVDEGLGGWLDARTNGSKQPGRDTTAPQGSWTAVKDNIKAPFVDAGPMKPEEWLKVEKVFSQTYGMQIDEFIRLYAPPNMKDRMLAKVERYHREAEHALEHDRDRIQTDYRTRVEEEQKQAKEAERKQQEELTEAEKQERTAAGVRLATATIDKMEELKKSGKSIGVNELRELMQDLRNYIAEDNLEAFHKQVAVKLQTLDPNGPKTFEEYLLKTSSLTWEAAELLARPVRKEGASVEWTAQALKEGIHTADASKKWTPDRVKELLEEIPEDKRAAFLQQLAAAYDKILKDKGINSNFEKDVRPLLQ